MAGAAGSCRSPALPWAAGQRLEDAAAAAADQRIDRAAQGTPGRQRIVLVGLDDGAEAHDVESDDDDEPASAIVLVDHGQVPASRSRILHDHGAHPAAIEAKALAVPVWQSPARLTVGFRTAGGEHWRGRL